MFILGDDALFQSKVEHVESIRVQFLKLNRDLNRSIFEDQLAISEQRMLAAGRPAHLILATRLRNRDILVVEELFEELEEGHFEDLVRNLVLDDDLSLALSAENVYESSLVRCIRLPADFLDLDTPVAVVPVVRVLHEGLIAALVRTVSLVVEIHHCLSQESEQ